MSLDRVEKFGNQIYIKTFALLTYTSSFKTKPIVLFQYRDDFNDISMMVPNWSCSKRTSNRTLNMAVQKYFIRYYHRKSICFI